MVLEVIALEGPQGAGKTSLLSHLSASYDVEPEVFVDLAPSDLHPQGLLSEMTWAASWFQRVLRHKNKRLLFVDRSPYSAGLYAKAQTSLLGSIVEAGRAAVNVYSGETAVTVSPNPVTQGEHPSLDLVVTILLRGNVTAGGTDTFRLDFPAAWDLSGVDVGAGLRQDEIGDRRQAPADKRRRKWLQNHQLRQWYRVRC